MLEKDIKNINSLKDLENLKDLNISIKDGDSKIEINTKNKQFQFSWVADDNNRNFRNPTLETKQPKRTIFFKIL